MSVRTIFPLATGLVLAALFAGACDRGPLSPPTLEPLEVEVGTRWLRDRKGRVTILRGATLRASDRGRNAGQFDGPEDLTLARMRALGMNLVRIPLSWRRLQPTFRSSQSAAADYLNRRINPIVRLAAAHGLAVVLTMRTIARGACKSTESTVPSWVCDALERHEAGDENAVACAFWRAQDPRGKPLASNYTEMWTLIAGHYASDSRVVGFDLIDEPVGSCLENSAPPKSLLWNFYEEFDRAYRRTGAMQALFLEPAVDAKGATLLPVARFSGPIVFSPHVWSQRHGPPPKPALLSLGAAYREAAAGADELGAPLLVGQYGGNLPPRRRPNARHPMDAMRGTSASFVRRSLAQLDRHLIGGAFYAFAPAAPDRPAAPSSPVETALSRPYARRVAGIPTHMHFSHKTRQFRLSFNNDPEHRPADPTEVFLPVRQLYPEGFEVSLSNQGTWHFDQHNQRLLVYRGTGASHELLVQPSIADDPD